MPRLSKVGSAALAAFGWTGLQTVTANYLVVAGGGSGGGHNGGAGGAGGLRSTVGATGGGGSLESAITLSLTTSYTVTVGAGAAGTANSIGAQGSNSVFSTITATGGGYGGSESGTGGGAGGSGGSGGGAGSGASSGGAGTASQGYAGGSSSSPSSNCGAGGGGAGAVASNISSTTGTAGGAGVQVNIDGNNYYWAGGGGGSAFNATAGNGGIGGGGGGGTNGGTAGTGGGSAINSGSNGTTASNSDRGGNGGANTGGGGGGTNRATNAGGSGGSGIVIISYPAPQKFGGGVVTTSGSNVIHTFNTSGTLTPLSSLTASYLVVAGGGGGGTSDGNWITGGGGAGGLLTGSGLIIDSNSIYTVTVGAGGAAETNGSNSLFSMVTTTAVGGGRAFRGTPAGSGGSGGGSSNSATTETFGTGTSGQGNNGGTLGSATAGGGGGAGAVGGNGSGSAGGNGGAGTTVSAALGGGTYAGGGGGGAYSTRSAGTGGSGGGGAGALGNNVTATAGTANTGGGGGGNGQLALVGTGGTGGAGGSGVVIISYAGSTQQMAGGTVTITGGNVIHTFTSSGYLTPIKLVNNSLRFRSSASAYLNRTLGTATNSYKWTWSAWVKRGTLGVDACLFSGGTTAGDANQFNIRFNSSSDTITMSSDVTNWRITSQVFRDPSAWYHFVLAVDTTQATAANRILFYINGVQVTSFSSSTNPTQNTTIGVNTASAHNLARRASGSDLYFDGYMTEINFIDGQQLTPNSFGTINSYGVWQPITYGGSYGINGFYLPFTNTTSTTTLGYDFSPNGNNWTTNNISVTAGATYDSMTDVPTLTSATAANYCVLNPLAVDASSLPTITNGNLAISVSGALATIPMPTGKWYWEATCTSTDADQAVGAYSTSESGKTSISGTSNPTYGFIYQANGNARQNGTVVQTWSTFTNNDILSFTYDASIYQLKAYKNNSLVGTITLTTPPSGDSYVPMACCLGGSFAFNFGQQPWTYTPPSGFIALNTYNL